MTEEKLREVYDKYYRLVMKAAYDVLKDFDVAGCLSGSVP